MKTAKATTMAMTTADSIFFADFFVCIVFLLLADFRRFNGLRTKTFAHRNQIVTIESGRIYSHHFHSYFGAVQNLWMIFRQFRVFASIIRDFNASSRFAYIYANRKIKSAYKKPDGVAFQPACGNMRP